MTIEITLTRGQILRATEVFASKELGFAVAIKEAKDSSPIPDVVKFEVTRIADNHATAE